MMSTRRFPINRDRVTYQGGSVRMVRIMSMSWIAMALP